MTVHRRVARKLYADGRLEPKVLQITGVFLLLASATFWAATGRESALMIGAALSMIGVGSYTNVVDGIREIVTNGGSDEGGVSERRS